MNRKSGAKASPNAWHVLPEFEGTVMTRDETYEIEPIAHIRTPFPEKFGIPRQSGLVTEAKGTIVFEPKYRDPDALRGIEGFSHLWLIWGFSDVEAGEFSPLVRPPRLGGNEKRGVFATRSPFRPNELGLSVVKLENVVKTKGKGTVLEVSGVDLLDKTPIYDIKPYVPCADAHPQASGGFASDPNEGVLIVDCDDEVLERLGDDATAVLAALARDPRPAYHDDPERVYEMRYGSWTVCFSVDGDTLTVHSVE